MIASWRCSHGDTELTRNGRSAKYAFRMIFYDPIRPEIGQGLKMHVIQNHNNGFNALTLKALYSSRDRALVVVQVNSQMTNRQILIHRTILFLKSTYREPFDVQCPKLSLPLHWRESDPSPPHRERREVIYKRTFSLTLLSWSSYVCAFNFTTDKLCGLWEDSKLVLKSESMRVDLPSPVSPEIGKLSTM